MHITKILDSQNIPYRVDVDSAAISYFGSGGGIRCLIEPSSLCEAQAAVALLDSVKYHIIGGCSNTLISDEGVDIVLTLNKLKDISVSQNRIKCYSGSKLQTIVMLARKHQLKGIEFLTGIPGTFGGAVCMNAGAFGKEIKDVLESVTVLERGTLKEYCPQELGMEYRNGQVKDRIVMGGTLKLERSCEEIIRTRIREYTEYRQKTQPQERSLGSVFKRVNNVSAAFYIEKTGLKGMHIGGAELSLKHCNFIINKGGAKSADYIEIVNTVKKAVSEYGINLELENILLGYE